MLQRKVVSALQR